MSYQKTQIEVGFAKEADSTLNPFIPKSFTSTSSDKLKPEELVEPKLFLSQEEAWRIYLKKLESLAANNKNDGQPGQN